MSLCCARSSGGTKTHTHTHTHKHTPGHKVIRSWEVPVLRTFLWTHKETYTHAHAHAHTPGHKVIRSSEVPALRTLLWRHRPRMWVATRYGRQLCQCSTAEGLKTHTHTQTHGTHNRYVISTILGSSCMWVATRHGRQLCQCFV
jgi:hypothetical protein